MVFISDTFITAAAVSCGGCRNRNAAHGPTGGENSSVAMLSCISKSLSLPSRRTDRPSGYWTGTSGKRSIRGPIKYGGQIENCGRSGSTYSVVSLVDILDQRVSRVVVD